MNTKSLWRQLRHALGTYPSSAAEWAVRVQCPDVTRQELLALDDWLKADPRHAEDYARVNTVSYLGLSLREHRDQLAQLQGYQRLRESERLEAGWMRERHPWRWAAAAAACGALVALVIVFRVDGISGDRYAAGHGEQRQVMLADGTRVVVNTDSEVNVRYDAMTRVVSLPHGEAFFEVARHPTRPFIVRAGDTQVQAIGTKFSVRRDGAKTQVIVTEGRVRVSRDGGNAAEVRELSPGHRLQIDLRAETAQVVAVDAARETAWAAGTVEFDDAPLDEVVREVNRYTTKAFVIAEPQLSEIRLTGRFRVGDMESVKFALQDRFGISAAEDGKEIRLARE